jgi:hypothetical protein
MRGLASLVGCRLRLCWGRLPENSLALVFSTQNYLSDGQDRMAMVNWLKEGCFADAQSAARQDEES